MDQMDIDGFSKQMRRAQRLYFGLLVGVGSVPGEDLGHAHSVLLGRQVERGQAALETNTHTHTHTITTLSHSSTDPM